jgi:ACS family sodium-dependent inorganic phosphate cotransporter
MAKFTPRWGPENFTFLSHKTTLTRTPVFNFSLNKLHPHLHSLPSLKFRVLCSIKEKENVKDTDKVPEVLTGLRVNEFDKPGSGPESASDWNWPPWQNIPERYKLIGTTSLAFVICNMDKVYILVYEFNVFNFQIVIRFLFCFLG